MLRARRAYVRNGGDREPSPGLCSEPFGGLRVQDSTPTIPRSSRRQTLSNGNSRSALESPHPPRQASVHGVQATAQVTL
jgi:hypothetical protein